MRKCYILLISLACSFTSSAQVDNEARLVSKLFTSLQYNDGKAFNDLFAGVDSLAYWILQHADKNSVSYRKMYAVAQSDYYKMQYDSAIHEEAYKNFNAFLDKAGKLNIHWGETIFMRYELDKMRRGRGLITEEVAQLRFLGYIFFKDQLTQKVYCFTVSDIMQVNGNWYGGALVNIFEANTKEKYEEALRAERKRQRLIALGLLPESDSTQTTDAIDGDEHEKPSSFKEVMERRYYKGTFDNEISVILYVRYIKGPCKEGVCSWEALFKFGDQDDYVKMVVSRTADGKWQFNEELGGMDLTLDGDTYTGMYSSSSDKTGYEVYLKQIPVSPKRLQALDEILESGEYSE